MPPTSTLAQTNDVENMNESFLEKMKHQQMLLYIVCGLGGLCLVIIAVFIFCKCKADRDRRKAEEKRKTRQKNQRNNSKTRRTGRSPKINPKNSIEANGKENRSRKRSRDMRNENRQNGGNRHVSIEEMEEHI